MLIHEAKKTGGERAWNDIGCRKLFVACVLMVTGKLSLVYVHNGCVCVCAV